MAGVQLPELKRNMEAPAPASAGRIESKMPDLSGETAQATEGLTKIANSAFTVAQKYELDAIDDEKLKAKITYSDWYRRKIEGDSKTGEIGLQHQKGDPTEAYNAFDKEAKEKFNEILNNPNLSGRARAGVQTGLLEAYNSLHANRLVTYGNQHAKYQTDLADSASDLEVEGFIDAIQFADASDPKSLGFAAEKLDGIRKIITNLGLKNGGAVDAPDGDVKHIDGDGELRHLKMNPVLKDAMKKKYSKAVGTGLEVLIDSKKLPEAKMVMDEFKGYMDGATLAKMTEKFQKKEVEISADTHLAKIQMLPEGGQASYLNKMPKDTPQQIEIWKKLRDEINDNQVKKNAARDRQSDQLGDVLYKNITKMQDAGQTYASWNDFMKGNGGMNEKLANSIDDRKVLAGLRSLVDEPPKVSDQTALTKLNELYAQKDGIRGKSAVEMTVLTKDLTRADATPFWNFWRSVNNETPSEESSKMSRVVNIATMQFKAAGLYEKKFGGVTENSEAHLNDFLTRMRMNADTLKAGATEKEISEWVAENMAQEVLKVKGGGTKNRFLKWKKDDRPAFIPPKSSRAPSKPKAKTFEELDEAGRKQRYQDYKTKFGEPKSFQDIQNWIPEE